MKRKTPVALLVLRSGFLAALSGASCTAVGPPVSQQPDSQASVRAPEWLAVRIREYEKQPQRAVPLGIWQITHNGQSAYYVYSPCCDMTNPLLSADGREICSPSGGFSGKGDGKCPLPMDRGTKSTLVWSHPAAPLQTDTAPGLSVD